jgi:hypothetical protein
VPQAEFVAQAPADTKNDDLAVKVSPIEQLVKTLQLLVFTIAGSGRKVGECSFNVEPPRAI